MPRYNFYTYTLYFVPRKYLFDPESNIAFVVEPNRKGVPVGDKHPLPQVKLTAGDDQRVLTKRKSTQVG